MPLAEFRVAPSVVAGLRGDGEGKIPAEGLARGRLEEEALRVLGADAVGVLMGQGGAAAAGADAGSGGEWSRQTWGEEVAHWAGRDLFVWVVIDGPWQGLAASLGWSQATFLLSGRGVPDIAEPCGSVVDPGGLLLLQHDRVLAEVGRALEGGVDGIVLGEDVEYAGGPFLPPPVIRERLWPFWGDVTRYCSGVRTARGDRPLVCFHGNGSTEDLLPRAGGLMVGTCSRVVPEGVPAGNLLAAYRAVTATGASDGRVGGAGCYAGG